jgi:hypothetical protein
MQWTSQPILCGRRIFLTSDPPKYNVIRVLSSRSFNLESRRAYRPILGTS